MPVEIVGVIKKSHADKALIASGDMLVSVNGHEITDVLDYMYYSAEIDVDIKYLRDGNEYTVSIKKSEYDDLGLEFSTFLMDNKQSCCNKCIFCFIDQMPPGMRETLYFKDDDARLSFLQGNYVTLTNLSQKDVDRIINMHLGINVSVHTTNPKLRCMMMNNRFAGQKLDYLRQFSEAGIKMNCQIVLCPDINDGTELERTLTDIGSLMPNIQSVAVVPVGLTKFREGLYPLTRFDMNGARKNLDIIHKYQNEFLKKWNTRLVFASDEFYLTANLPLPDAKYYEDYCQYENGVGMLRSFYDEFIDAISKVDQVPENRHISIATGTLAYEYMCSLVKLVTDKWNNIDCKVYPIINDFFGDTITVSGLLTGQDIIAQLTDKSLGDTLLLTKSMIKKDSDLFLDDYVISDVEKALNIKIRLTDNDGYDLLDAILGTLY